MGTVVVLLTFTIKEAWRDSEKDRVDDLDKEADRFNTKQLIESTQRNVLINTKVAPSHGEDKASLFQDWQRLWAAEMVDTERLGSMTDICKRLTCDALAKFEKSESVALDSNAALVIKLRTEPTSGPVSDEASERRDSAFLEELMFSNDLDQLQRHISEIMEQRKTDEARLLKDLTIFSIVLYFIGATIGIVGTLADIEPKKVGE